RCSWRISRRNPRSESVISCLGVADVRGVTPRMLGGFASGSGGWSTAAARSAVSEQAKTMADCRGAVGAASVIAAKPSRRAPGTAGPVCADVFIVGQADSAHPSQGSPAAAGESGLRLDYQERGGLARDEAVGVEFGLEAVATFEPSQDFELDQAVRATEEANF